jgi:hypothetical protein
MARHMNTRTDGDEKKKEKVVWEKDRNDRNHSLISLKDPNGTMELFPKIKPSGWMRITRETRVVIGKN